MKDLKRDPEREEAERQIGFLNMAFGILDDMRRSAASMPDSPGSALLVAVFQDEMNLIGAEVSRLEARDGMAETEPPQKGRDAEGKKGKE